MMAGVTDEDAVEVDKVYRCRHGVKIATRFASGTWVGHRTCWRCAFKPWRWPVYVDVSGSTAADPAS